MEMARVTKPKGYLMIILANVMQPQMIELYKHLDYGKNSLTWWELNEILDDCAVPIALPIPVFSRDISSISRFEKNNYIPYVNILIYQKK
jgi:hypothetical protein